MRCTLMNLAVFLAMSLFMASCFADEAPVLIDYQPAAASANQTTGTTAFSVPQNGTPAEYLAFIEKLSNVERPQNQTRKEAIDYLTKLCKAQIAAANKVIEHKDATSEQIRRAVSVKIKSLQILIKLGSNKARAMLEAIPTELEKAGQPKIADDIAMALLNLKFKEAKRTNDFSEIEKIIAQTTEAIAKTPAENKNKLQRLYRIKLICIRELGKLKGVDNSAEFDAVVAEVKAAGLMEMVEDVVLSRFINALSDSTARNDKALFDRTAQAVDNMIANYGARANSKVAAVAFRTANAEEVFDSAAAAARYTRYANYFGRFRDAKIQEIVKTMQGSVRRLSLRGRPLPVTGKTVDGKDFNMANLRNKNVLVFAWSPSDPSSVERLNYLRRAYPAYQARGFEVVGVVMDSSPQRAAAMARRYQFPWANMSYQNAYVGNVPFCRYYGFGDLSRMIMLNRQGLVSSANLNYRSLVNELEREYGRLTKEQIDAFNDIDFTDYLDNYDNYDFDRYLDDYDDDWFDFDDDFIDDFDDYDDDYDDVDDDIDDLDDVDDLDNDIDDVDDIDDIDDVDDIDDLDDIDDVDDLGDVDDVDDLGDVDDLDDVDDLGDEDDLDDVDDLGDDNVDGDGADDDGGYDGADDDDGYDGADDDGGYDDGGYDGADDDGGYDDGGYDDGGYDDGGYDDGGYDDDF